MIFVLSTSVLLAVVALWHKVESRCKLEDTYYLCFRVAKMEQLDDASHDTVYQHHNMQFDLMWVNRSRTSQVLQRQTTYSRTIAADASTKEWKFSPDWAFCKTVSWSDAPTDQNSYDIYVQVFWRADSYSRGSWLSSRLRKWKSEHREGGEQMYDNPWNDDKQHVAYTGDYSVWLIESPCYKIYNATINDTLSGDTYDLTFSLKSGKTRISYQTQGTRNGHVHHFNLLGCPFAHNEKKMKYLITSDVDIPEWEDKSGKIPKKSGMNVVKLEHAKRISAPADGEHFYEHLYAQSLQCPKDKYEEVVEALQITFITLLSILAFFTLLVFCGALYSKFNKFDGMDSIKYFNVFWIFVEIYKFISDLAFMILLGTRSKTIPFFVLVFLAMLALYASNVLYLAHLIEVWTHEGAPKHTSQWISEWKWLLYTLTLCFGGIHPALEVANSLLFPIAVFAMHVPYAEIMRVRSERSSTMVVEMFPLMVLQFVYFLLVPDLQGSDFIFGNAVTASIVASFISTTYFFTKAEIEEKPIIATHTYHLKARGPFADFMSHCQWNFQKAIALSVGVRPSQVMVESLTVTDDVAEASGRIIYNIEQGHSKLRSVHKVVDGARGAELAPSFLKHKLHLSAKPTIELFRVEKMPNGDCTVYDRSTQVSEYLEQMKNSVVSLWAKANVSGDEMQGECVELAQVKSTTDYDYDQGEDEDGSNYERESKPVVVTHRPPPLPTSPMSDSTRPCAFPPLSPAPPRADARVELRTMTPITGGLPRLKEPMDKASSSMPPLLLGASVWPKKKESAVQKSASSRVSPPPSSKPLTVSPPPKKTISGTTQTQTETECASTETKPKWVRSPKLPSWPPPATFDDGHEENP